ncbi:asparagine synthase-related protein [Vibrio artabrorum]|uniref:asparagine synthase-related protein n=1 Tax=Vibrio artabrorum TaxID=446374 RepID=UPI00355039C4
MRSEFKYCNYLTGIDAYISGGDINNIHSKMSDVLHNKENITIDSVGVLGILMKNYCLLDRTLVSGVSKYPWMAKINTGEFEYFDLPRHKKSILSDKKISSKFIDLMEEEAFDFVQGKKDVGILLSGGMDSRIVAGILRKLEENDKFCGNITAITWGETCSRDVIYSQRIAKMFGWEFLHIPITEETLYENISIAGIRGAEYSPVHLHAMNDVSKLDSLDGILAGSYGDSIGRGEYSGLKANNLKPILDRHLNHFSFLTKSTQNRALETLKKDVLAFRERFPGRSETSYRELEMQAHYMRRQLNSCMSVINEKIPLYQMFSSPSIISFIWSLDAACRSDNIYEEMLKELPGNLLDIPWSRDGKRYNSKDAPREDEHSRLYHRYGDWLRNENRDFVLQQIGNGNLQKLGIFNQRALEFWSENWRRDNRPKCDRLDEKMAWLASLSVFVGTYGVGEGDNKFETTINDKLGLYKSAVYESVYFNVKKILNR